MANGLQSEIRGQVLLIAAAPHQARRRLAEPEAVTAALAAVPLPALTGHPCPADLVQLVDPAEPQAVLARIQRAAHTPGPLLVHLAGQLTRDRRGRRLHLALSASTPRTVRYRALPWHWLAEQLRVRAPGTTRVVVDLVADDAAWPQLREHPEELSAGLALWGAVTPPTRRGPAEPAGYTRALAALLRTTPGAHLAGVTGSAGATGVSGVGDAIALGGVGDAVFTALHDRAARQAGLPDEALRYAPATAAPGAAAVPAAAAVPGWGTAAGAAARDGGAVAGLGVGVPGVGVPGVGVPGAAGTGAGVPAVPPPGYTRGFTSTSTSAPAPSAADPGRTPASVPVPGTAALSALQPVPLPTPPRPAPPSPFPTSAPLRQPLPQAQAQPGANGGRRAAIAAALRAGRHAEADALARDWEHRILRTPRDTAPAPHPAELAELREVQALIATESGAFTRAVAHWLETARVRLTWLPPDHQDVRAAVDNAHHLWSRLPAGSGARELGAALVDLRRRVPGANGHALAAAERRLERLATMLPALAAGPAHAQAHAENPASAPGPAADPSPPAGQHP